MRVSQLLILTCGIAHEAGAFAPPSRRPRSSTVPALAIDASFIDPSIVSDPTVLIAGAGAAVAAAVAGLAGKGGAGPAASSPKAEKVDLSIPYDAAATLAYNAYAESSSAKPAFSEFKALYEAQMVAEVKAKSQLAKVNEKKSDVDELKAQLAAMEGELESLEGALAGLNDEAADYKSQIQGMFGQ